MNKLFFKRVVVASMLAVSAISAGCASSGGYSRPQMYYVDARVLQQNPTPERCNYVKQGGNSSAGTITGVLLGGLAGRQFGGSKNARNWGTAVGALFGGVIGAKVDSSNADPRNTPKLECKRDGWMATVGYIHPVTNVYQVTTVPIDRSTRAEYISIPVR